MIPQADPTTGSFNLHSLFLIVFIKGQPYTPEQRHALFQQQQHFYQQLFLQQAIYIQQTLHQQQTETSIATAHHAPVPMYRFPSDISTSTTIFIGPNGVQAGNTSYFHLIEQPNETQRKSYKGENRYVMIWSLLLSFR
jgi:hypothetical protein